MGFIKTLVIIILIYYAFKLAMRYLFPLLIYKVAKKAEQNFQQRQQDHYQERETQAEYQSNQERDITKRIPKTSKMVDEYVDFEEVTEDKKE